MDRTYRGIIFDLDGTLINTLDDLADSVNEALLESGYPTWPVDDYRLKVGRGFRNLMENSIPADKREDGAVIDAVLKRFVAAYDRRYMNKSCPYKGMEALLAALEAEYIQVAVNSNKRTDYTEKLIAKLFPRTPFVAVFGERQGVPKKPDPAGALEIADMMKLEPEEILYIGDSGTDMQTGKNAGMDTVGVAWGFRGSGELSANGAVYIVETAEEILSVAKGLFRKN